MWFNIPVSIQEFDVKPFIETRYRFERRLDRDFDGDKSDNRSDSFLRFRPGFEFTTKSGVSGRVVFQFSDTRTSWDSGAPGVSTDTRDLIEAHANLATPGGTLTLGRQKLNVGDQRLFGALEWSSTGRSWDAVRLKGKQWDAFVGKLAVNPVMNQEAKLALVAHTGPCGLTSLSLKSDTRPDPATTVWTLAHQWSEKRGLRTLSAHAALQGGSVAGRNLEAHALGGSVGWVVDPTSNVSAEFNIASGGGPTGTARTFDQLYPTGHMFYGATDMQGLRNMIQLGVSYDRKVTPTSSVKFEAHKFWLYDARDGWYGASGAQNGAFKDPTGNSGKDLGWEVDVTGTVSLGKDRSLGAGVALFVPGSFVRDMTAGPLRSQWWGYAVVSAKF